MRCSRLRTLSLALALGLSAPSFSTAWADAVPGHHGGQVQDAGPYHIELVAKPHELTLYVLGTGNKKVDTNGAMGSATVLSGKAKETVQLAPAGENVLKGIGKFEMVADTKVAVSVTFPGQSPVQARFMPFQKESTAPGTGAKTK